jgi:steroid delta-isomerase-like uncharacterized protein
MRRGFLLVITCVCALLPLARAQVKTEPGKSPKAVLAAYIEAWNRRDYDAFDRLLASDGVHEDLAAGFRGQGAAQVKEFMSEVLKEEPDFVWKVTNVIESGNTVVAEWNWTATHTGDSPIGRVTGKHITGRGATVAVIKNGRIQRFTDYYDNASFFPKIPGGPSGGN